MASLTIAIHYRMRHLSDAEWNERLLALSEDDRMALDKALDDAMDKDLDTKLRAVVRYWPDLIEVSTRPFGDGGRTWTIDTK